jgi:hypothetical protein
MRFMETLGDAGHAILKDLPKSCRLRLPWSQVMSAILTAADTGRHEDNLRAYESIVAALEFEGWLTRAPSSAPPPLPDVSSASVPAPAFVTASLPDRSNVVPFPKVRQFDTSTSRHREFDAGSTAGTDEAVRSVAAIREPAKKAGS